jgi:hypothetical protein
MDAHTQFSWLREFAIPAFFTLFGATLGFIASQIRDARKAKRDKVAFFRAIGMELDALGDQLDASFHEVKSSVERLNHGDTAPQFAGALRTSVFSSQLGKLRDVDDPLLIKIVHFYSDMGTLQQSFETVNGIGAEYNRAVIGSGEKDKIRPRVFSGLRVLQEQISGFATRLRALRAKLPPAETS